VSKNGNKIVPWEPLVEAPRGTYLDHWVQHLDEAVDFFHGIVVGETCSGHAFVGIDSHSLKQSDRVEIPCPDSDSGGHGDFGNFSWRL